MPITRCVWCSFGGVEAEEQSGHLERAGLAMGAANSEDRAAALGGMPKQPLWQHILARARRPLAALKLKEEHLVHGGATCARF